MSKAGVGTYGPRAKCGPLENVIWPASEFSLPKLEHNIVSKRNPMTSRHVDSHLKVSLAP